MRTIENKKLIGAFIGIELTLYAIFMSFDVLEKAYLASSIIKFIAIVLCFGMSVVIYVNYERFLDRVMLCIALFFTVIADIFLLFTDKPLPGVVFFCLVQSIYLARIIMARLQMGRIDGRVNRNYKQKKGVALFFQQFFIRLFFSCSIFIVLILVKVPVDVLLFITIFYIISFLANIIMVLRLIGRKHYFQGDIRLGLFIVGLLLFFICDIMVGIFNINGYVILPADIHRTLYLVSSIGMWMFYLPGQVLITLS